jgi:membrane protein implicated in regulation of membrane protease activity
MDDCELSVKGEISASRTSAGGRRQALDDILFLLMGEATPGNLLVMIFAFAIFASVPMAMMLLMGSYSGGMRWMITLGMVAVMGFTAVYLMRRGTRMKRAPAEAKEPKTEFRGELTNLTDAANRASSGYVYSQQVLRERLCEDMLDKLGMVRDLGPDDMTAMLEAKDTSFVGDDVLARFLLENRRSTRGWEENKMQAKGKSAERGREFMIEIDEILRRTEAIV